MNSFSNHSDSTAVVSNYARSIAASLTVDELRNLHRQALAEAEAKQTELRIVLASRYRDLVGSSEQVLDMRRSAEELDAKIQELPKSLHRVITCAEEAALLQLDDTSQQEIQNTIMDGDSTANCSLQKNCIEEERLRLLYYTKKIHLSLDQRDVYGAAAALIDLFAMIMTYDTNKGDQVKAMYRLAHVLGSKYKQQLEDPHKMQLQFVREDPLFQTQMKMTFLHVQTLPAYTIRLAKHILLQPTIYWTRHDAVQRTAKKSACALAAFEMMKVKRTTEESSRGNKLIDLYLTSKATLLQDLLNQLSSKRTKEDCESVANVSKRLSNDSSPQSDHYATEKAEEILSLIVTILQYDVILHSYHIFCLRRFLPINSKDQEEEEQIRIMSYLPYFDMATVKMKVSHFLAAHLPLIRSKAKTVLSFISTASRLGSIRQMLYDKTDGSDFIQELDGNAVSKWDDAVGALVDKRIVLHALEGTSSSIPSIQSALPDSFSGTEQFTTLMSESPVGQKFSLWNSLFSNAFSSLVHSILTTSFHSVHASVLSALRSSLARAPSLAAILPHEAHRNTLRIALELDQALKKVSDDAHELLVHAEEREESERRLKRSLYVHTCEIMGRLINELRRMLNKFKNSVEDDYSSDEEAVKEVIVGRLCHSLRFRVCTLSKLLDPNSSPSSLAASSESKVSTITKNSGMITIAELQSAFSVADDDDDGLISFDEAMDVMESAFAGTAYQGAQMVKQTLLLAPSSTGDSTLLGKVEVQSGAGRNVTLDELALLGARGLRHEPCGALSALGTIQKSLEYIVDRCFSQWASRVLVPSCSAFQANLKAFVSEATAMSNLEWKGEFIKSCEAPGTSVPSNASVSPYVIAVFLSTSFILSQSISPADSLPPISSAEFAASLGVENCNQLSLTFFMKCALKTQLLTSIVDILVDETISKSPNCKGIDFFSPTALWQIQLDIEFIRYCYNPRDGCGLIPSLIPKLESIVQTISAIATVTNKEALFISSNFSEKYRHIFNSSNLLMSVLLGEEDPPSAVILTEDAATINLQPLSSSRRFILLPVQADRSLNELKLLGTLEKDKAPKVSSRKNDYNAGNAAANAVSSFLTSMLGKKH